MKNALNYPELWQQKRTELPVDGDSNADWLEMQAMLDAVMPVTNSVKKPYNPKGLKGLYKLLIGFSTAAVIYGAAQLYLSGKQRHQRIAPQKTIRFAPAPVIKDSTAVTPSSDKLTLSKPVVDDQPIKDPALLHRIAIQPRKTDSLEKPLTPITDNAVVHRDSALELLTPGLQRSDSAAKTLPAGLNIKPKPIVASGSNKPPKKKRRKFQIGV